jgi:hypothetical protein
LQPGSAAQETKALWANLAAREFRDEGPLERCFTLVIAERTFQGPSADGVARDGAGYFMQYIRDMSTNSPQNGSAKLTPAPSKGSLGFARS